MKLWFSLFDETREYRGKEAPYIDPSTQRWSTEFEANYEVILSELKAYLENHNLKAYFNTSMVNSDSTWKTISLRSWGIEFKKQQKYFPSTTEIINKYPEIISLSFNLLSPGGKILPHCGDTNAIFRSHFGLDVPSTLPDCGFCVQGEERSWENGKWLIFMDAFQHEAWNLTENNRIIIVMDTLRDEYKSRKNKVKSVVITSLFLQKRVEKFKLLQKAPQWAITTTATILRPMALLAINVVNWLRVY